MTTEEIMNELENRTLIMSPEDVVNIATLASMDQGYINCDTMRIIVAGLNAIKKNALEDFKTLEKEKQKEENKAKAEIGEVYFSSLKEGDPISWYMADGTILNGVVGKQGENAKTAHCVLTEYTSKRPDRYVKFEKIIVSEEFKMEKIA